MAFNQFMHPRNRYKNNPPDFKKLAAKYPAFKEHTSTAAQGKVLLNFKDAASLRVLTQTLLKEDFDLEVEMPLDQLIPTVSLRLNYIHWLEDLQRDTGGDAATLLHLIDIGTGTCCIYPLLGCKLHDNWRFVATDIDETVVNYARENVCRNSLESKISIIKTSTSKESILTRVIEDSQVDQFHFCMCNPPFFSESEQEEIKGEAQNRRQQSLLASCFTAGGEVEFVKTMINESAQLQEEVRWYTSMLGKKSSITALKEHARLHKIRNVVTTEFCQGNTMRWGIAWSFLQEVPVIKPSTYKKLKKEKPSMVYTVPDESLVKLQRGWGQDSGSGTGPPTPPQLVAHFVEKVMRESLQLDFEMEESEGGDQARRRVYSVTALRNTWGNQRRKRREQMRAERQGSAAAPPTGCQVAPGPSPGNSGADPLQQPLLKFRLTVKQTVTEQTCLEMSYVEGKGRDHMHQVLQYLKNQFTLLPPQQTTDQ